MTRFEKKVGSTFSNFDERTQKAGIFIFLFVNVRESRTQFFRESSSAEKSDKKWKKNKIWRKLFSKYEDFKKNSSFLYSFVNVREHRTQINF
jgi:hypothetical protein